MSIGTYKLLFDLSLMVIIHLNYHIIVYSHSYVQQITLTF